MEQQVKYWIDTSEMPRCKHGTPEIILCAECCLEWLSGLTADDKRRFNAGEFDVRSADSAGENPDRDEVPHG